MLLSFTYLKILETVLLTNENFRNKVKDLYGAEAFEPIIKIALFISRFIYFSFNLSLILLILYLK